MSRRTAWMAASGTIVLSRSLWPDPAGARRQPRFASRVALPGPAVADQGRPRLRVDARHSGWAQGLAGIGSATAHALLAAAILLFWSRPTPPLPILPEQSVPLVFLPAAAPAAPAPAAPPPAPAAPPAPVTPPPAPAQPPPPVAAPAEPPPLPEPAPPPPPLQAEPVPAPTPPWETRPKPPEPQRKVAARPRERPPTHPSHVAPRPAATAPTTATPPAPAAAATVATAEPVQPPRLPGGMAQNCRPEYPRAALRDEIQGLVVMRVRVSPEGRAIEVEVARGSGSALLDNAAVAAVRTCRFAPATQAGRPVAFSYEVPYRFRLEN